MKRPDPLTYAQREALNLAARGCAQREIAAILGITRDSVKRRLEHACQRLDLPSIEATVAWFRATYTHPDE